MELVDCYFDCMQLEIIPSPSPSISLRRFREEDRTAFRFLSDASHDGVPLPGPTTYDGDFSTAIVFENLSAKDITALRYRWSITDSNGKSTTRTSASDSYKVDVYHPVALPRSRQLLSPYGRLDIDQSLFEDVRRGGGYMGAGGAAAGQLLGAELVTFEIELALFADGELAGPDPHFFAGELQSRKKAAGYVAKHVRLAMAEERDPLPVIAALGEMPHLGTDFLARTVCEYARTFLRRSSMRMGIVDWKEAALKHLEDRPAIPRFYRTGDVIPPSLGSKMRALVIRTVRRRTLGAFVRVSPRARKVAFVARARWASRRQLFYPVLREHTPRAPAVELLYVESGMPDKTVEASAIPRANLA